jgi:2-amino-4-hydroxy-6-hydroxymethyldihydropteridine diphosphokinase
MSGRWLLQLGSNLDDAACLQAAVERLGALGAVRLLGPVRHWPPRSGEGAWYFNALLELDCDLAAGPLRDALREIEAALGRDRSQRERVAIDIDPLAERIDGAWRADAHALAKGELDQLPASRLLEDAGIAIQH